MLLCKDALCTKKIRMLVQTFWEEDLSRTKGVTIDINCNLLVELKIILLLCRGGFFVLVLKCLFDILLRLLSEDLEALFLLGLINPRSETE